MRETESLQKKRPFFLRVLFPFLGTGSLLWFLFRVIPKPSRAGYPCMRVAAPIASTFVLWLLGAGISLLFLRQACAYIRRSRFFLAIAAIIAGGIMGGALLSTPHSRAQAAVSHNAPIGTAKGAEPGRVVWVHDSSVSDWLGAGHGHWWLNNHTKQAVVNKMMSQIVCNLGGKTTDTSSWDTLFRYFNVSHGRGDKGYTKGEKIAIKINLTMCSHNSSWWCLDTGTYALNKKLDFVETTPQVVRALLAELINVVKANQADISVGDPSTYYANEYYDSCHAVFPNVNYIDCGGKFGRTRATLSDTPMYWSCRPTGVNQDYIPNHYVQATYVINIGPMKSHMGAGVTLCAKNNYGSLIRLPTDSGYYSLHQTLAFVDSPMGQYRAVVDLMGHPHLGGKTLLYLIDGLYEQNHNQDTAPHKWSVPPFNGGWTASLFASQDPVAIECVLFDLFQLDDDSYKYPTISGAPDYLNEAAQANNPPSGTFYDPSHATATNRLASLGVCEHWNNSTDRKYSRNLGTGTGIELVFINNPANAVLPANPARSRNGYSLRALPGNSMLEVLTPVKGPVRLLLLDNQGRVVETVFSGEMAAGSNRVNLLSGSAKNRTLLHGGYIAALYGNEGGAMDPVAACEVELVRR